MPFAFYPQTTKDHTPNLNIHLSSAKAQILPLKALTICQMRISHARKSGSLLPILRELFFHKVFKKSVASGSFQHIRGGINLDTNKTGIKPQRNHFT